MYGKVRQIKEEDFTLLKAGCQKALGDDLTIFSVSRFLLQCAEQLPHSIPLCDLGWFIELGEWDFVRQMVEILRIISGIQNVVVEKPKALLVDFNHGSQPIGKSAGLIMKFLESMHVMSIC